MARSSGRDHGAGKRNARHRCGADHGGKGTDQRSWKRLYRHRRLRGRAVGADSRTPSHLYDPPRVQAIIGARLRDPESFSGLDEELG